MRRCTRWWLPILTLMALVCAMSDATAASGPRLALVIGNADYAVGPLPTAANDAGLVAQSLAEAGYDVTAMGDTDAATLRKTLAVFADKLRSAGTNASVFVYLTGYGVQFAGDNFIVPVAAKIDRQTDVPLSAVPLSEIAHAIEALPARSRVFVYDLARENPLAKADATPLASGLTMVRAPRGSLYAFNAAPGTVAHQDVAPYGLYARALVEMLRMPDLGPRAMFARVRLRIAEITNGAVIPWDDASQDDPDALGPGGAPHIDRPFASLPVDRAYWTAIAQDRLETYQAFARSFATDVLATRVKTMVAARLEASVWSESVLVDVPTAYWTYMQRYPRGPHYVDVRRRLAAIHAPLEPPPRFDPYVFANLPEPPPDQVRAIDRADLTFDDPNGPSNPPAPTDLLPPASPAIYLELAPPPLVPTGVLPIPMPLLPIVQRSARTAAGRIEQPFVPGLGLVTIRTGVLADSAALSLSTEDGPGLRSVMTFEKGERTIIENNAAEDVVSRTTVKRAGSSVVTITQSGLDGALLSKIVTHIDPLGEKSTEISNGAGELVAAVRADRRGVITDLTRGTATLGDAGFDLPVSDDLRGKAQVLTDAGPPPPSHAPLAPLPAGSGSIAPDLDHRPATPAPSQIPALPMPPKVDAPAVVNTPPPVTKPADLKPPAAALPANDLRSAPPQTAPQPVPRPEALKPRHRATRDRT